MKKKILVFMTISFILSACFKEPINEEIIVYKLNEGKTELFDEIVMESVEIEIVKRGDHVISMESRDIYYFENHNKEKIIDYVTALKNAMYIPFENEESFSMGIKTEEDKVILYMKRMYEDINPENISDSYYEYCFPSEFINKKGEFSWDEYLRYLEGLHNEHVKEN